MSSEKSAYRHSTETTGFGSDTDSPATEHRDTVGGADGDRNEVAPEQRRDEPGRHDGPTTHDDTKITRKKGT